MHDFKGTWRRQVFVVVGGATVPVVVGTVDIVLPAAMEYIVLTGGRN